MTRASASTNASIESPDHRLVRTRASISQGELSAKNRRAKSSDKTSSHGSKDNLKPKAEIAPETPKVAVVGDKVGLCRD